MKHLRSSTRVALVGAAALLCCAQAQADEWSNSVRAGSFSIFYHTSADDIAGPYVPPGANLKAQNVETLYVAYVRSLSSRWDVELAVGYPPLVKVKGAGPATVGSVPYNGEYIASSRWIAPSLLLEYKFMSENSAFRPYIGVGVNYATFYDRESTAAGNAVTGGPTRISLTSSVGPAATIGLSYHISGHWYAYGSYSAAQVKSDLTANTAGVIRTTHISFGPQALIIAAGYSF